jgi:hypothetical protein
VLTQSILSSTLLGSTFLMRIFCLVIAEIDLCNEHKSSYLKRKALAMIYNCLQRLRSIVRLFSAEALNETYLPS